MEGWRVGGSGETLYFSIVTGLTIGYGDLVTKLVLTRIIASVIGLSGIVLTGLVVAVSVQALNAVDRERGTGDGRAAC